MSDAIAIDTQYPWHHSVHKWLLYSAKSESKREERVEEYTNPATYACFEHTEKSQHRQWCQPLSHRGDWGRNWGAAPSMAEWNVNGYQLMAHILEWTSVKRKQLEELHDQTVVSDYWLFVTSMDKIFAGFTSKLLRRLFWWCQLWIIDRLVNNKGRK